MSENFVVVSTVHPVAGRLYLRMIEENTGPAMLQALLSALAVWPRSTG